MEEILKEELFATVPAVDEAKIDAMLETARNNFNKKIVVLDDDPTGIQTVHDVYVYTDWDEDSIREGFAAPEQMFFILTNSRALSENQTAEVYKTIAERIQKVAGELQKDFIVISRSDSTLRGHFPLETQTLNHYAHADGEIIIPFFKEGGRFTFDDIHYVQEGKYLTPAAETEFAKGKRFGYSNSDLKMYIEEKSHRKISHNAVMSISLDDLRALKIDEIVAQLESITNFGKVIVNAIDYVDIKIFTIALLKAMERGKRFLFRTAASFPKVIGGVADKEYLSRAEVVTHHNHSGGLIVVGSYMEKSTKQLHELHKNLRVTFIEFNHLLALKSHEVEVEIERVVKNAELKIQKGQTVAIFTGRKFFQVKSKDDAPQASRRISDALAKIVSKLNIQPKFLIAKGGVTSSDIGTKGLGVKKAFVIGEVDAGIPVWKLGEESKFPDMPYIIFPGNVGETDTLRKIVKKLQEG